MSLNGFDPLSPKPSVLCRHGSVEPAYCNHTCVGCEHMCHQHGQEPSDTSCEVGECPCRGWDTAPTGLRQ